MENSGSRAWQLSIFCLLVAVAMEDVTRLVSSGDCLKIWDSTSMTVLEQFSPHCATHPVAQVCWSSSSILQHCQITLNHFHRDSEHLSHVSQLCIYMIYIWLNNVCVSSFRRDIPEDNHVYQSEVCSFSDSGVEKQC